MPPCLPSSAPIVWWKFQSLLNCVAFSFHWSGVVGKVSNSSWYSENMASQISGIIEQMVLWATLKPYSRLL